MLEKSRDSGLPFVTKSYSQLSNVTKALHFAFLKTGKVTGSFPSGHDFLANGLCTLHPRTHRRWLRQILWLWPEIQCCRLSAHHTHHSVLIDVVRIEDVFPNVHHVELRSVSPYFVFYVILSLMCRPRVRFSGRVLCAQAQARWRVVQIIRGGIYSSSNQRTSLYIHRLILRLSQTKSYSFNYP